MTKLGSKAVAQVRLRVDPDSFTRSKKSTVFGSVWFEIDAGSGKTSFPGNNWSDLATGFVRVWIEALVKVGSSASPHEEVSFMDGPYAVEMRAVDQGLIEVSFFDSGANRDVTVFSGVTEFRAVLQNAIEVGREVARVYQQRNWSDDDEAAIRVGLQEAVTILKRNREDQ